MTRMIPIENGLAATSKMAAMAAILKNPLCSDIHEIFRKVRGNDKDDSYWKILNNRCLSLPASCRYPATSAAPISMNLLSTGDIRGDPPHSSIYILEKGLFSGRTKNLFRSSQYVYTCYWPSALNIHSHFFKILDLACNTLSTWVHTRFPFM